jgi:hypothetical protein
MADAKVFLRLLQTLFAGRDGVGIHAVQPGSFASRASRSWRSVEAETKSKKTKAPPLQPALGKKKTSNQRARA